MKSLLLLLILPVVLGNDLEGVCKVNQRILGGKPAAKYEFPGVVFLEQHYTMNGLPKLWLCAGSLVTDHWVLTAAHCLIVSPDAKFQYYRVYPTKGSTNYIQTTEGLLHAHYSTEDQSNDIGLIRLPVSMSTIDPFFKTVSLPVQGQPLTSDEITYVGWGITSTTDNTADSHYLMKVEHVPVNQSLCADATYDESQVLCVHPTSATGTACVGDSGGPIFMDGLQVGIVSKDLTIENGPNTYITRADTRVSGYRTWIDSIIYGA